MSGLAILIPVALLMGLSGLAFFFWAMRNGQFEDLDGAAQRVLIDDEAQAAAAQDDDKMDEKHDKA
ncbi:cbb3-type cytochrome oxidase assembly protein CcoS [Sphingorhabdus sp. EL138]|jgi:cbb3-type cytochrome oxidase maturation protein|uniref:cbb3-type cytochrome oxidase assembly protein CcoS n=1 Tax=Sphingorhabdus sp. EL138 TaxID=2073156 RepID=UPI000D694205|nr:cbb3-type cytochrome oxidase assembly protein CcoS [Sphingorhabdus sp. EL138]